MSKGVSRTDRWRDGEIDAFCCGYGTWDVVSISREGEDSAAEKKKIQSREVGVGVQAERSQAKDGICTGIEMESGITRGIRIL